MPELSRRRFIGTGAIAPLILHADDKAGTKRPVLGAGDHVYEAWHDWGELPASIQYGNTHGVVEDSQGRIYVHHTVGSTSESSDSMVVFDAIFPVVTATIAGLAAVDKELIWSARNMGAGERELTWQVALPAALPQILTGLQVALPIALIVEIVVEMAMGGYGLGGVMMSASRFADSRGVFAGIAEIAIVGYALIRAMSFIRRRLLVWHDEAEERA